MKYVIYLKITFMVFILKSCSFNDSEMNYEDKLVAFASISANLLCQCLSNVVFVPGFDVAIKYFNLFFVRFQPSTSLLVA